VIESAVAEHEYYMPKVLVLALLQYVVAAPQNRCD